MFLLKICDTDICVVSQILTLGLLTSISTPSSLILDLNAETLLSRFRAAVFRGIDGLVLDFLILLSI